MYLHQIIRQEKIPRKKYMLKFKKMIKSRRTR